VTGRKDRRESPRTEKREGGRKEEMKGYHNNHNQGKRRWRCLVIGVLFLVLLSMLVPLVFLLGLYHNGFHSTGNSFQYQHLSFPLRSRFFLFNFNFESN
jgi:hypothetical protein